MEFNLIRFDQKEQPREIKIAYELLWGVQQRLRLHNFISTVKNYSRGGLVAPEKKDKLFKRMYQWVRHDELLFTEWLNGSDQQLMANLLSEDLWQNKKFVHKKGYRVYGVFNFPKGEFYFGSSSNPLSVRIASHRSGYTSKHLGKLLRDRPAYEFVVLPMGCYVEFAAARWWERNLIENFDSIQNGLNERLPSLENNNSYHRQVPAAFVNSKGTQWESLLSGVF